MRNLSIDAAIVPVIYRLVVTSQGDEVGRTTHQCIPSDIDAAVAKVEAAMSAAGYSDVSVECSPA